MKTEWIIILISLFTIGLTLSGMAFRKYNNKNAGWIILVITIFIVSNLALLGFAISKEYFSSRVYLTDSEHLSGMAPIGFHEDGRTLYFYYGRVCGKLSLDVFFRIFRCIEQEANILSCYGHW